MQETHTTGGKRDTMITDGNIILTLLCFHVLMCDDVVVVDVLGIPTDPTKAPKPKTS